MSSWTLLVLLVAGYLLGGFSAGFWLVRWRTGGDVRSQGSGSTGATNVGRVLGSGGFAAALLLDAAKGALVAGCARWLDVSAAWAFGVGLAVIVGHVWPIQLGFRGGKGVAPMLGAWLVLAPLALAPCLLAAVVALAGLRRWVIAGLCGLAVLPVSTWWVTGDTMAGIFGGAVLAILLHTHRAHLRRWLHPQTTAS